MLPMLAFRFAAATAALGAPQDPKADFVKEVSKHAEAMKKDAGALELRFVETYTNAEQNQALGQACVPTKRGKGRLDCHFSRAHLIRLGSASAATDVLIPSFLGAARRLVLAPPAEADFEAFCDGYKDHSVVDPGEVPFPALIALVEKHCEKLDVESAASFAKGAGELLAKSCLLAWTVQGEVTLKPEGKKKMIVEGDGCDGAFTFEHDGNLKGIAIDERGAAGGECADLVEDNSEFAKAEKWAPGFVKVDGCETVVFEESDRDGPQDKKKERFSDAMRKLMDHEPGEALSLLKAIPAGDPWRAKAVLGMAVAELALKKAALADKSFADAYATIGEAPFGRSKDARIPVLLLRGKAALESGKVAAAHVDFDRALQLDLNHAPAVYWLARSAAKLKKFDEAAASFKKAVALASAWKRVFNLGSDAELDPTVYLELSSAPPLEKVYADAAVFLATVSVDTLRDVKTAMTYAKMGVAASQGKGADEMAALAVVMAEAGDFENAKKMLSKAMKTAKAGGEARKKEWKAWMAAIKKKKPIRDP